MRLPQLEYVVAIAEEGSYTAASTRLTIAQPSLSQQVAALEKELERLAMAAVEAADTIQPGTDGLSPEARALRWQLHHLAARLRGAAQAGADTRRSARELITQQDAVVHSDPVLV